ncbi:MULTISPECIES: DUF4230 domain-containing protein [Chitinophagaceae]
MKNRFLLLLIVVLVLIIGVLAFLLGKKGKPNINESIVNNTTFIKQIAELSTLEAHGVSSLKHSNLENDGSFTDAMRRVFMENTVNYSIPYVAKYGIDMHNQNVVINTKDSTIEVHLPQPQLLSYELQLDKMETNSQRGWFQSASDAQFATLEKKLYTETRREMEQNKTYLDAAKVKVQSIISDYYKPLGYKAVVVFGDSATLDNTKTMQ